MNWASLAAAFAASLSLGVASSAFASDEAPAAREGLTDNLAPNDRLSALRDQWPYLQEIALASPGLGLRVARGDEGDRSRAAARPPRPMVIISATLAERHAEEDSLLGSGSDDVRMRDLMPFVREIAVDGVVAGSFADSVVAAGVPAPAMLDFMDALTSALDIAKDVRDGSQFHVRYRQEFTAAGAPIDVGRVLWAEVRTNKGVVAIHRFRGRDNSERFWLSSGLAVTPPSIRLPLETVSISSGFGLRADPFDQPPPAPTAGSSRAMGGSARPAEKLLPGLPTGGALDVPRASQSPLGASQGLSSYGGPRAANAPFGGPQFGSFAPPPPARPARSLFMHEGVDLVAPAGTPVHAAADGVVIGAAPNGRYGNWVRIEHGGKLATVYGHMAGFAPGIEAGVTVLRGDVIGFVGSTGRSTGAHLHFELLSDGKPVNPIIHPETKRAQLRGAEFDRFRKQVSQSVAERDREAAVAKMYAR